VDVYKRIVQNLRGRVNTVNLACALGGVDDWAEGVNALNVLVENGRVDVENVKLSNGTTVAMYKLSYDATTSAELRRSQIHVVVSNTT